jgi:hypothetical protein
VPTTPSQPGHAVILNKGRDSRIIYWLPNPTVTGSVSLQVWGPLDCGTPRLNFRRPGTANQVGAPRLDGVRFDVLDEKKTSHFLFWSEPRPWDIHMGLATWRLSACRSNRKTAWSSQGWAAMDCQLDSDAQQNASRFGPSRINSIDYCFHVCVLRHLSRLSYTSSPPPRFARLL